MKLPIVKSLHIENFTGTGITVADYFNTNAIIGEYEDGRMYATQRPSIDIFDDASVAGVSAIGRGIYFWRKADAGVGDRYIVIDDKVYKGSLGTTAIHTFAAGGTSPVYFVEMVNYLVILDPENNAGYWIINSNDEVVVQIIDGSFPGQAGNAAEQLIAGGAFLDGRCYIATESATIYSSGASPADWDSLDTISAEREADRAIFIDKHLDHIVLFGSRTIEFFYNAGNPAGQSPLSKRQDISHNVGMLQGDASWREGDNIYFVGVYPSGPLQVLRLSQFKLESISTPEIESYISNARLVEDANLFSSGFSSGKRTFYILTFYRLLSGVVTPSITLVFDGISWGIWDTDVEGLDKFPLLGWTIRSGSAARSGEGIMFNGDLVTIRDDFIPTETVLASAYFESVGATEYIQDGYYVSSGGAGVNVVMTVRTGPFDGDTNYWKFGHTLEVVGDETAGAVTALVKWADGNSVTFNAGRTVNLDKKEKITRLGRFKRRNHEVVIDIDEQYRIEALEMQLTEGGH